MADYHWSEAILELTRQLRQKDDEIAQLRSTVSQLVQRVALAEQAALSTKEQKS